MLPAARPLLENLLDPDVSGSSAGEVGISRSERVFVNRDLKLADIDCVGFDMDYTLAIYRQDQMDALSIDLTFERMVKRGYPSYLQGLEYDTRFPIRGLLIDKHNGHILKMDRHKVVSKGYHGTRPLDAKTLHELYVSLRIRPELKRYHWIDTLFALSEATSYAATLDALERRRTPHSYGRVFQDIRESIDEAHADGTVYRSVTSNLDRFVERDPLLSKTLHKLRSAGKKLFLLTNSPPGYTQTMMSYLLDDAMPEYPSWRQYFDIIVCSAKKPTWFKERHAFQSEKANGPRSNGGFERGQIYLGGNLKDFEERLGIRGSSILYIGDHIYGDILRSKKESSWRTAMIIPELGDELEAHEKTKTDVERERVIDRDRQGLEDELRYYQQKFRDLGRSQGRAGEEREGPEKRWAKTGIESVRGRLHALNTEHAELRRRVDGAFHPYWGSLLKEAHEMSSFGLQVNLYADIYTRRVSCLHAYSAGQYFRSPHDLMPHEL